jgi:hypothetical protein
MAVMTLFLAASGLAATHYYAIGATATRTGYIYNWDPNWDQTCALTSRSVFNTSDIVVARVRSAYPSDRLAADRGYVSFPLSGIGAGEYIKWAQVRLTVDAKADTFATTDVLVYRDTCCIGTSCSGPLTVSDSNQCTNYLTTLYWTDLPEAGDSLRIDLPPNVVKATPANTFDLRFVGSRETAICDSTEVYKVGVDRVAFNGANEDTLSKRPVLYVITVDTAECAEAGRVWYNAATGQLSYCDGFFIWRIKEE